MNKWKKRILYLFYILIALIILEVSARLIYSEYSRPKIQYDPLLIWKYVPNSKYGTFTSNSFGFRDYEHYTIKKSNRVMFLGDSYTAGVNYPSDEIFPTQVQGKLNNTEVFNFGVSAYATDQQYLVLKEYAIKYDPDVIILTVAPNDFRESYMKNLFYLEENELILNKNNKAFHLSKLNRFFWKLSLKSQAFYMLQLRRGKKYGSFEYVFNEVTTGVFFKENKGYNADAILFLKNETKEMQQSIKLFSKLIEEMSYICKENKIKFLIVNLPIKMQFDGTMVRKEFDQKKISNILKNITVENDIYYLDLYPIIKKSEDPLSYYISEEYHLNKNGHDLVANEIHKKLLQEKLD